TNTAGAAATLAWMFFEWNLKGSRRCSVPPRAPLLVWLRLLPLPVLSARCHRSRSAQPPVSSVIPRALRRRSWAMTIRSMSSAFTCVGGILGALLTGVFASKAVNPAGADGLLFGNPGQLAIQATAVGATLVFAAAGTAII